MIKVKKNIRKLPIPMGLILAIVGLFLGILLVDHVQTLKTLASSDTSPRSVKLTNIDSTSFVVSWITQTKTGGAISYGETSSLGEIKQDLRYINTAEEKYNTHFILLDNLKPQTKYLFEIISSGKKYNNSGKPYEITTAPDKIPSDSDIAQGKILISGNQVAIGAIVYISLPNTVTQAAITDKEGHWMIPLSKARSIDLNDFSNYDHEAQTEEIFVQGDTQTANAVAATASDNPLPDIVLGQTYDFLNQLPETSSNKIQQKSGNTQGFGESTANSELKIIYPSENEQVNSFLPEFIGTGPKSQNLNVKVESPETISAKTNVDQEGKWNWTPTTPLSPGEHKITVSYTDNEGFLKTISKSFIVLAAGESDLPSFTATPSGKTITPTATPSLKPTIIPKVTITTTPVPTLTSRPLNLTPTSISLLQPTLSSTRTSIPSNEEAPVSGSILPTKIFLGAGIFTLIIGAVLVLF